jgi:toxin HigB-1
VRTGDVVSGIPGCCVNPFRLTEHGLRNSLQGVIRGFKGRDTETLFRDEFVRRFAGVERVAQRKLLILDAVKSLGELRSPPGNRLEALKGNRKGQYSIRINDQWRICFLWHDGDAWDVEIVDYH